MDHIDVHPKDARFQSSPSHYIPVHSKLSVICISNVDGNTVKHLMLFFYNLMCMRVHTLSGIRQWIVEHWNGCANKNGRTPETLDLARINPSCFLLDFSAHQIIVDNGLFIKPKKDTFDMVISAANMLTYKTFHGKSPTPNNSPDSAALFHAMMQGNLSTPMTNVFAFSNSGRTVSPLDLTKLFD